VSTASGCAWSASTSDAWIGLSSPSSGSGNATVGLTLAPNPGGQARAGAVVVASQRVVVVQAGTATTQCAYTVSLASTVSIPAPGGSATVPVAAAAGCPWTATSNVPWITVAAPGLGSGNGVVVFSVATNPGIARTGTVVIAGQTFTVAQAASPTQCSYAISAPDAVIGASGGTGSVSVVAAGACAWVASSNAAWITVTSGTTGSGGGVVAFSVAPNTGPARSGTITVASQVFTVHQAAAPVPCTYAISPPDVTVAETGGAGTVAVTAASGCAWTASSNAPWIAVTSGAAGSGNGAVAFTVAANSGPARSGTISAAGQTFTVNQRAAAAPCSYSITPPDTTVAADGGLGSIAVTAGAGCAWTATSNAPWIAITSGAGGSGPGAVAFSVAANTGPARSGTITVAGQTFTVNQAAAPLPCTYAISPPDATVGDTGGAGTVAVTAAAGCAWTAASTASWITVTSGGNGSGDGVVGYSVAANTGAERTGTIAVAGQTFTVRQAAAPAPCTYGINPSSAAIGAQGGTGNVAVTAAAGCTWTAASNDAWIAVTAGASGTGNGTVAFSTAPNPGGARTGTITIAGQTFTVTQAALTCSYAVAPTSVTAPSAQSTQSVTVTAGPGCTWTAQSHDGWLDITSGRNGSGDGTVTFIVRKHDKKNSRSGRLTIAGQTVTVDQQGRP
jgi:hypothetical protein